MFNQGSGIVELAPPTERTARFQQSRGASRTLKLRLRRILAAQANLQLPIGYSRLASGLSPSGDDTSTLRKVLERTMEEDVRKGRPLLAALAVVGPGRGLPAPWFFRKAQMLGRFVGHSCDVEAFAFHARELHRCIAFYSENALRSNREVGLSSHDQPFQKESEHA